MAKKKDVETKAASEVQEEIKDSPPAEEEKATTSKSTKRTTKRSKKSTKEEKEGDQPIESSPGKEEATEEEKSAEESSASFLPEENVSTEANAAEDDEIVVEDEEDFSLDDTDDFEDELTVDEDIVSDLESEMESLENDDTIITPEINEEFSDDINEDIINDSEEDEEASVTLDDTARNLNYSRKANDTGIFGAQQVRNNITDTELKATLRYVIAKGILLSGKLITTRELKRATEEGEYKTEIFGIFKLEKPFDKFQVRVPFNELFTPQELLFLKTKLSHLNQKGLKWKEYASIELFKGGRADILLTKISKKNFMCQGSRTMALARKERIYFDRGVLTENGSRKFPKEGSLIRGCNIFYTDNRYIRVDVCGIPTRIDMPDLSYIPLNSAKEKFKKGDKVDVVIKNIQNKRNIRKIKASVKECFPDPTKKAFDEAKKYLGVAGRVTGSIVRLDRDPNKCRYFIYTDLGYNALALSHKIRLTTESTYMKDINPERLKVGTEVVFEPYKPMKNANVMLGKIVDVV